MNAYLNLSHIIYSIYFHIRLQSGIQTKIMYLSIVKNVERNVLTSNYEEISKVTETGREYK